MRKSLIPFFSSFWQEIHHQKVHKILKQVFGGIFAIVKLLCFKNGLKILNRSKMTENSKDCSHKLTGACNAIFHAFLYKDAYRSFLDI